MSDVHSEVFKNVTVPFLNALAFRLMSGQQKNLDGEAVHLPSVAAATAPKPTSATAKPTNAPPMIAKPPPMMHSAPPMMPSGPWIVRREEDEKVFEPIRQDFDNFCDTYFI